MKYTENLNLRKPESDDFYDIEDFNSNADQIDSKFGDVDDQLESNADDIKSTNDIMSILEHGSIAGGKNLLDENAIDKNQPSVKGTYHGYAINVDGQYTISISDKDTSVNISDIFFGVTKNGSSASDGFKWLVNRGTIELRSASVDQSYKYLSFYLPSNNADAVDRILKRFNIQIEKGTTATKYESFIPSVKMLGDSASALGKCKNLLGVCIEEKTVAGVTLKANGDGTYTITGTNTSSNNISFPIDVSLTDSRKGKLIGCPKTNGECVLQSQYNGNWGDSSKWDSGNGAILPDISKLNAIAILVYAQKTVNFTFKPMITTNLNVTYDDYVPFTGSGKTLIHDVDTLNSNLVAQTHIVADKKSEFVDAKYIQPSDGSEQGTATYQALKHTDISNFKKIYVMMPISNADGDSGYAFYNESKALVKGGRFEYITGATGLTKYYTLDVPSGAKYFRCGIRKADADNFRLYGLNDFDVACANTNKSLDGGNIADFSKAVATGTDYYITLTLYKGFKYTFSGNNSYKSFRTTNDTAGVVAGNQGNTDDVVYTPTETRTFYLRWYGQANGLRIVADKIIADLDNRFNQLNADLSNKKTYTTPVGTLSGGYAQAGCMVIVSGLINLTTNVSNTSVIAEGLPPNPLNGGRIVMQNGNDATYGIIGNDGKLRILGSASSGTSIRFHFSYLTN